MELLRSTGDRLQLTRLSATFLGKLLNCWQMGAMWHLSGLLLFESVRYCFLNISNNVLGPDIKRYPVREGDCVYLSGKSFAPEGRLPMKVKNINGTTQNVCKCKSWLKHWENYSSQSLSKYCAEKTCTGKPEIGAHVQKDTTKDKSWYIVPLCKTHNNKTGDSLELISTIKLASANVSTTCGKA